MWSHLLGQFPVQLGGVFHEEVDRFFQVHVEDLLTLAAFELLQAVIHGFDFQVDRPQGGRV